MRLIDADKLAEKLKGLKEQIDKISINREARCLVDVTQVIEYVENAPTVEANSKTTCASCANNQLCIMAGDGNWKACKDYQPTGNGNDLIRRADVIEAVAQQWLFEASAESPYINDDNIDDYRTLAEELLSDIPSAEAEQVTGKLKKTCDSLLTGDSDECKEQKSKLESAEAVQGWIPCSERLPKINQEVLLSTADGKVFVGHREKPDLVWQVTETDGRKHWVYDPEAYTDDVDGLPKAEDCGFDKDSPYLDGLLSVTSVNYDNRFDGVTAWMPLPKPYTKGDNDEER